MGREGTTSHVETPPMFWCFTKMGNLPRNSKLKKNTKTLKKSPQFLLKGLFTSAYSCLVLRLVLHPQENPNGFSSVEDFLSSNFLTIPNRYETFRGQPLNKKKKSQHPKDDSSWRIRAVFVLLDEIRDVLEWSFCWSYFIVALKIPKKLFRLQVTQRQKPTCHMSTVAPRPQGLYRSQKLSYA